ncbi:MAG: Ig-like domain-containing protein [Chloroflexi bacterium]|nr:Ig-like domain-containing protein [Chloroflexota bacterium]
MTQSAAEIFPPVLVARSPELGERLAPDGVLELTFDRAMDPASEAALKIQPALPGAFSWPNARTLRFTPTKPWPREAEFVAVLDVGARAADGVALAAPLKIAFSTQRWLGVGQTIPADGTTGVAPDTTITVLFDRPVVSLTLLAGQGDLPNPLRFEPPIAGKYEWLNTSVLVFHPSERLAGGVEYTGFVAKNLQDVDGAPLSDEFRWKFRTALPRVISALPQSDDNQRVRVDAPIVVRFDQFVDLKSATAAFSLSTGAKKIKGSVVVDGDTLTFTPATLLDFDTLYSARVAPGVKSAAGGVPMSEDKRWDFRTVPLPKLLRIDPSDGARTVEPGAPLTLFFNTDIDPAVVMSFLHVTPPLSPALVYTYYNEYNHSFTVNFDMQPATQYSVRVDPGIRDPYGNRTSAGLQSKFKVGNRAPWLQPHLRNGVSMFNARTPIRIAVDSVNVARINIDLYQLSDSPADMKPSESAYLDAPPASAKLIRRIEQYVQGRPNESTRTVIELGATDGRLPAGAYLVVIDSPQSRSRRGSPQFMRTLYVSDINLVMKSERSEMLLWATDLSTGAPVADLELEAYERTNTALNPIGSGRTDENGVVRIANLSSSREYAYDTFALVRGARFAIVSAQWTNGFAPYDFGLPGESYNDSMAVRSHVYTDRPIYRAGQKIFVRGVVRRQDDFRYDLPGGIKAHLQMLDSEYAVVHTQDVTLDAFGAFSDEVHLADDAKLGDYQISMRIDDIHDVNLGSASAGFKVAAYRPPDFKVTVQPARAEMLRSDEIATTALAAYLSGSALREASLNWNIVATAYDFKPPQLERYSFRDDDDPWSCYDCWWQRRDGFMPALIASGFGRTDMKGRFAITAALPAQIKNANGVVISGPIALSIETNVTGADDQVLSGRGTIVAHPADLYVGVALDKRLVSAGEKIRSEFVTVDWQGRRFAEKSVQVVVVRREWKEHFVPDNNGGHYEYAQVDVDPITFDVTTNDRGEAQYEFAVPRSGTYKITAVVKDAAGHSAAASRFFWASGQDIAIWRRNEGDRIDLLADKSTYEQGDVAKILIPSPFIDADHAAHYALVTVERGHVLHQEVVRITSSTTVYTLPIDASYAPNVYVSAVLVSSPKQPGVEPLQQRLGLIGLRVIPRQQTMNVTITPDRERPQPGETVTFTLRAVDAAGAPISGSFSVDVVDKGVLNLQPRERDAIVNTFYGPAGLRVQTVSGLNVSADRVFKLSDMQNLSQGRGSGSEMPMPAAVANAAPDASGAAPAPALTVRENFADTAFWRADIVTDDSGRAQFAVKLADNLTTWVVRAVGIDAQTHVGEAVVNVVASKPLMIRPVTPRFFVVDDVAVLGAIVQNTTAETLTAQVSLQAAGVSIDGLAQMTTTIPADSEALVTWTVRVLDAAQADLVFSVVAGKYSDAAKPRLATAPNGSLRIERYIAPETVGTAGELSGEDVRSEVVVLPKEADAARSVLELRLDASLASAMREGLGYLEHYPYECIEQIVSRFVPNVLTYRALDQLGIEDADLVAKLSPQVVTGMAQLKAFQNQDGGWGWWPHRDSEPNVSAWAVYGLLQARDAGFDVPMDALKRGLDYLDSQQHSLDARNESRHLNWQAWLQYVLAEADRSDESRIAELFKLRANLDHYGRALLILAMGRRDPQDARMQTLFADLNSKAITSATGVHWEEASVDWWAMNTDTRTTALVLTALARFGPKNALAPNVVRWLMQARAAGSGYWRTTQETAWSLIALTDWMRSTGELAANYAYAVRLGDAQIADVTMSAVNITRTTVITVPGVQMAGDAATRVTLLKRAGEGRLYYTAQLKAMLPASQVRAVDRGIVVQRRYVMADCVDGVRCPSVKSAKVGDVLRVELTIIAPSDLYYLQLEDPLPAGAEAIDATLATASQLDREPALNESGDRRWWWFWNWWSRSELRDDRVSLFADQLGKGTYTYSYTMRVTTAGEFNVRPTYAALQYFPEVFGRGDGMLFVVGR